MRIYVAWMLGLALVLATVTAAPGADVKRMDVDTLKSHIEKGDVVVLDVRSGRDWRSSEFKIKGALRADPGKMDAWSAGLDKSKAIVTYCA
jgi:rhodanese-related sulfurtransferase